MIPKDIQAFPSSPETSLLDMGLTKREYAAIHILAGLFSNPYKISNPIYEGRSLNTIPNHAKLALEYADELLRQANDKGE